MDYEWDEAKRWSNIDKHKVDFRLAAFIFEGPVILEPDHRRDYGEERFLAIGFVDNECFVVAHTRRGEIIRLISAWKGGRNDRRKHQALYPG
ncbi:BrnT family toxin [Devosia sp. XJ19-1]|uniref:BrnT family toxin n=1 Tax=Devosia ureilytica TaxID=2952754 RepID=A0A9Q4FU70_9HYPH|nr:BrnT family toxin [Devosia ureilytica]MCP8888385.1 BrnT family toxin [Devosia ureilytica]